MILPQLHSQRLVLREMRDNDIEALFAIYGDPEVMRYASDVTFPDIAIVSMMLGNVRQLLANGESLEWAVAERDSDRLIGTCGIHSFHPPTRTAEIGAMLNRAAWGMGYMQEALPLVIDHARSALRLGRLIANIDAGNERSVRLFLRLGFVPDQGSIYVLDL